MESEIGILSVSWNRNAFCGTWELESDFWMMTGSVCACGLEGSGNVSWSSMSGCGVWEHECFQLVMGSGLDDGVWVVLLSDSESDDGVVVI